MIGKRYFCGLMVVASMFGGVATSMAAGPDVSMSAQDSETPTMSTEERNRIILASVEPLTQSDIDHFVEAVEAYETWLRADEKRRLQFVKLSPPQKQMKLRQLLGHQAGVMNDLMLYVSKMGAVMNAAVPNFKPQTQVRLEDMQRQLKSIVAEIEKQNAGTEAYNTLVARKTQLDMAIKITEKALLIPQSSIDLFAQNSELIVATIKRLEQADKSQ